MSNSDTEYRRWLQEWHYFAGSMEPDDEDMIMPTMPEPTEPLIYDRQTGQPGGEWGRILAARIRSWQFYAPNQVPPRKIADADEESQASDPDNDSTQDE